MRILGVYAYRLKNIFLTIVQLIPVTDSSIFTFFNKSFFFAHSEHTVVATLL